MEDISRGLERVPTGIRGLDTVLNGGFFQGGLYLIQGTPGTGKTTLANQICFNHIRGRECALYVTLLAEFHARMVQSLVGMSFFDQSKLPDQLTYISAFRTLREDGLAGLLALIRREIIARNVSLLILDGLVTAQRAAHDDQAFNVFVHELQGIAGATNCTLFLVTSTDRGGKTMSEHTMVDGIVELNDQYFGWYAERAMQITKLRGTAYLRGKHAYKITDDGVVVYPRIEALLAKPSTPDLGETTRVSSGIEQLDTMLGGGLPVHSTTMLLGPSGIGKTTFGLQFLSQCTPAAPGLIFGFYEMPARLEAKAREICRPLASLLESGVVEVLWQPPTDDSLDAYGERLLDAVRRRGVRRLFVDGLSALRRSADASERMPHYLRALLNELRSRDVTTLYSLEATHRLDPNLRPPFGDLSSLAENLILMRYVELHSKLHRIVSILKVRDSNFDSLLREFSITAQGVVVEADAGSAEAIMRGTATGQGGRTSGELPQAPVGD